MPVQQVKCPICHKKEIVPQSVVEKYRTCSTACRDVRMAKNARLKEAVTRTRRKERAIQPGTILTL